MDQPECMGEQYAKLTTSPFDERINKFNSIYKLIYLFVSAKCNDIEYFGIKKVINSIFATIKNTSGTVI